MTSRKIVLLIATGLFIAALFAYEVDEPADHSAYNYEEMVVPVAEEEGYAEVDTVSAEYYIGERPADFEQAMEGEESLQELENARDLYKAYYPEQYESWIEAKTSDPASPLKYFYLWFSDQDDVISRINAGRQLIERNPDQIYGYRLMLLAYIENYPFDYYFDESDEVQSMFESDLKYLLRYYQSFPDDEYHTLAGIIALNLGGRGEEALDALAEAYQAKENWFANMDISRIEPMEQWHELLYALAQMITEDDAINQYYDLYSNLVTHLASYYFEEESDYDRVVTLMDVDTEDNFSYEYDRFMFVYSLYKTGQIKRAGDMLLDEDIYYDPVDFHQTFMGYEELRAREMYRAVMQDRKEPLAQYLRIASDSDQVKLLQESRVLIGGSPQSKYGYLLMSKVYWENLVSTPFTDAGWADWISWLDGDKKYLRTFYIRFPEEEQAQKAYLLYQIYSKKKDGVLKSYSAIIEDSPFSDTLQEAEKIIADLGNYDLLWDVMALKIDTFAGYGILEPEEKENYYRIGFSNALYNSEHYDTLVDKIYQNPNWLDDEDIQYAMANALFNLERYGDVIDILRLMIERKSIDLGQLYGLQDLPVAEHPNWPALIQYAEELNKAYQDENPPDIEMNEPEQAPNWTLPDVEGNLLSLEDLRGQIVILDFWATWCGPCQRAMPVLDNWMKSEMPEGVRVLSINVWEEDRTEAIRMMNEKGYAMELLFGDEELTEAYGVEGIPYICIIDEDGMIRGSELGFNSQLGAVLNGWIKAIRGE